MISNYTRKLDQVVSSVGNADVVAILIKQAMRSKALLERREFEVRRRGISSGVSVIGNPITFLSDAIPITVKQQEAFTLQADVTQYPMESGSIITDHVILNPLRVDISFEVSNWEQGTAKTAFETIERLWQERTPVDLLTYYKKIPNMVLTHFQGSNSIPEWGKLSGRATFQQVKFGQIQTQAYMGGFIPTEKTLGPDMSKSAEPEEDQGVAQPKESLAEKLWEGVFTR